MKNQKIMSKLKQTQIPVEVEKDEVNWKLVRDCLK